MKWYDANANNPPWIKALADVRRMGTLEGYCFHHVQAIMIAIDQYAETALGNREYFLNRPHSIGGRGTESPPGQERMRKMASGLKFWIDILSALFAISAAMMWIFSSQVRTADEKPRASGDASKKTGIP